ncbi:MAG TPA: ATP-binding protein [Saprospiraceae bacterium]|nr:ATP-binding protein [Saprospiraceae bacterium]
MGIVQRLLSLPSNPEHIHKLEPFLEDVTSPYCLDQGSYGKILISLTEAVNNAIRHGNKFHAGKDVSIKCHQNGKTIKFWVSDEGKGFDPVSIPSPTGVARINIEGGRGVFLMRELSDHLKFKNNGSTVELCFNV